MSSKLVQCSLDKERVRIVKQRFEQIIGEVEEGKIKVQWTDSESDIVECLGFSISKEINQQRLKKIQQLRERKYEIKRRIQEIDDQLQ